VSTAVVLGGISLSTAYADMLVLAAQSGGEYDYGIQLDANHGLVVDVGDQITLSGLSGVTAATVLPGLSFAYSSGSITSNSVTIVATTAFVLDPIPASHVISVLQVSSLSPNTDLVDYQVQTGSGVLEGTVLGPVATVPEPGEFPTLFAVAAVFVLKRAPNSRWKLNLCGRSLRSMAKTE
jgi:hypothetical protein